MPIAATARVGREKKLLTLSLIMFSNPYVKNLVNQKDGSMRTIDLFKVYNAPNINQMCFDYYGFKGQDEIVVNRNGLILSIFRKIEKY